MFILPRSCLSSHICPLSSIPTLVDQNSSSYCRKLHCIRFSKFSKSKSMLTPKKVTILRASVKQKFSSARDCHLSGSLGDRIVITRIARFSSACDRHLSGSPAERAIIIIVIITRTTTRCCLGFFKVGS